jgi:hypothetical protein
MISSGLLLASGFFSRSRAVGEAAATGATPDAAAAVDAAATGLKLKLAGEADAPVAFVGEAAPAATACNEAAALTGDDGRIVLGVGFGLRNKCCS